MKGTFWSRTVYRLYFTVWQLHRYHPVLRRVLFIEKRNIVRFFLNSTWSSGVPYTSTLFRESKDKDRDIYNLKGLGISVYLIHCSCFQKDKRRVCWCSNKINFCHWTNKEIRVDRTRKDSRRKVVLVWWNLDLIFDEDCDDFKIYSNWHPLLLYPTRERCNYGLFRTIPSFINLKSYSWSLTR